MTTFRSTCFLLAVCFTTILAAWAAKCLAAEKASTHPGILHSSAELDFVKGKVAEGEEPWKSAWEELRSHGISELDWKPDPFADVVRGVRNNPDIGGTNLMRDGAASDYHKQLARLISFSPLHIIHWINIAHHKVTLATITNN